jgi:16S rRNA (cytidine1402-2'-O)-methyltransferase
MKHAALMPGTLFVVATPIGNLDDITLRALRVLREVAVIAAEDTRRTAHLLARHGITTSTTSLHEHNETKKSAAIVARLIAGDSVALVSDAGTPTVSDPGVGLVRAAVDAGIRVEPIPGPSALIAALSASGLSTESFTFLGFPPTRAKDRSRWFNRLAKAPGVAIFYEAPHRIRRTLGEVTEKIGDRWVAVGRELTKAHEQLVRGPISKVLESLASDRGEFTVVVDTGSDTETAPPVVADGVESRRAAIAALAKSLGVSANELYRVVEQLRN